MNYDYEETVFSKTLFIGLFNGIAAALLCLLYDFFFILDTGFPLCAFVNVSTIIFTSLLLFVLVGLVYHF